jgi:hypothetical protein
LPLEFKIAPFMSDGRSAHFYGHREMTYQAESDLFLLCLGAWDANQKAAGLKAASTEDWQDLLRQAYKYRMLPALFWQLKPFLDAGIQPPQGVVHELRTSFLSSTGKNMLLFYRVGQFLKAMDEAWIPVILLKGAHLANFVYPDSAMRSMSDVDFLIPREDILRCAELFYAMGYKASVEMRTQDVLAVSHQLPYFVKSNYPLVELHWTILDPKEDLPIDLDGIWARAEAVKIHGYPARVLSPEDLLLHIILHTSHHHNFGTGLKPFYDIAVGIQHYRDRIDWSQLFARAAQWKASKGVYLALLLTHEFFGTPIPTEILEGKRPGDLTPQMVDMVRDFVLRYEPQVNTHLAALAGSDALPGRTLRFVRRLFPSRAILGAIYNISPDSPWIFGYYLIRPFDLLRTNATAAWKLLRRDREALAAARRQSDIAALRKWISS